MSRQYVCFIIAFFTIYIYCQHGLVESIVSGRGEEGAGSAQAHYCLHTCLVVRMWMKIKGRRARLVLQPLLDACLFCSEFLEREKEERKKNRKWFGLSALTNPPRSTEAMGDNLAQPCNYQRATHLSTHQQEDATLQVGGSGLNPTSLFVCFSAVKFTPAPAHGKFELN